MKIFFCYLTFKILENMKKLTLLLGILFLFISSSIFAQNNSIEWLNGSWEGIGYQTNNQHRWSVEFEYDKNSQEATISYPSLQCSGVWEFVSMEKNKAVFTEKITKGKSNCIDGSKIVINKINEEYIGISWFSQYIEGVDAYAALKINSLPKWLEGKWTGVGYQPVGNSTWDIELNYSMTEKFTDINYPSLKCSGKWALTFSNNNRAEFIEQITEGTDRCVELSRIVVTKIDDEYVQVSWFSEHFEGIDAVVTLRNEKMTKESQKN